MELLMSGKQHNIWISQEAADALLELSAALNIKNQRGEPSLSALIEWLGQTAIATPDELVKLLDAAGWIASGGEWDELDLVLKI
jgi:hypothetical protein